MANPIKAARAFLLRRVAPGSPAGLEARLERARDIFLRAKATGNYEVVDEQLQEAETIARSFAPGDTRQPAGLARAAEMFEMMGKYARAEELYREALAGWEQLVDPDDVRLAVALNDLALLLYEEGKHADAEPFFQRQIAIVEKHFGERHRELAVSLENYAASLRFLKRDDEAAQLRARARRIRAELKGRST